ncbi:MAG: hypothetical protein AAF589_06020 [Planctomycetota bacterium]
MLSFRRAIRRPERWQDHAARDEYAVMPGFQILFIIGVAVAIIAGAIYARHREGKRTDLLRGFALGNGWFFNPAKDYSHAQRYHHFDAFRRGRSRYSHNNFEGTLAVTSEGGEPQELQVRGGDYHYTVKQGKNSTTYRISYLLIGVPGFVTDDLLIRTENLGDKMKAAMGFDDIDFESAEFSDRFWVKSRNKRFAYDVIHPRMMEFLLTSATPDLQIDGGLLCLTSTRTRWDPQEFELRLGWAARFFALWPQHLLESRGVTR